MADAAHVRDAQRKSASTEPWFADSGSHLTPEANSAELDLHHGIRTRRAPVLPGSTGSPPRMIEVIASA
jgi:hypothetical protein